MSRGYFGIGAIYPKNYFNIGTLFRSAQNFGASFLYTIGRRYTYQSSDTGKATLHLPCYHFRTFDDFINHLPNSCPLIGIEQHATSQDIKTFVHPERACYLLGAEDMGIAERYITSCHRLVHINTPRCLNVSVAGSILMFDRQQKLLT